MAGSRDLNDSHIPRDELLGRLLEQGALCLAVVSPDGRITFCNDAFGSLHGRGSGSLAGEDLTELYPPHARDELDLALRTARRSGSWRGRIDHPGPEGAEGTPFPAPVNVLRLEAPELPAGTLALSLPDLSVMRDVMERRGYEEKVRDLYSLIGTIRNVDRLITRESDPSMLIRKACSILTGTGGFLSCWIARLDGEGGVTDRSESGLAGGGVALLSVLDSGELPVCAERALSSGDIVVTECGSEGCAGCPAEEGADSEAAFLTCGLEHDGRIFGVISAGIDCDYAGSEEHMLHLSEVAEDLAYSLHNLEAKRERRASIEALRESRNRFDSFMDQVHGPVSIRDASSRYLYVNRFLRERMGASGWIGRRPGEVIGGEVGAIVEEADREALSSGYVVRRLELPGAGDDRTYEARIFRIEREGKPPLVGGIGVDITERLSAELALRRNEELYRTVFENTGAATVMLDDELTVVLANRGFEDISGYSGSEAEGSMRLQDMVHPDDREHVLDVHTACVSGEIALASPCSFRFIDSGGSVRHASLVLDRIPGTESSIASFLDVTDLQTARGELQRSLDRTRALLVAMPDLMFVVTREGVFNDFWANQPEMLALPPESVVGSSIYDLPLGDDDLGRMGEAIELALDEGTVSTVEYSLDLDGEERYYEARFAPYGGDEVVSIIRDLTAGKRAERERRLLEAQVQHTQKLESLGVLAGGIAHDFNNILMAILGNADLTLQELPLTSPVRHQVKEIETAAGRAADLARQMLAYSGRGSFQVQPMDLNGIITELTHMLEVSISKKAVMKLRLAEYLPKVMADATQIRQVLMNLITNASEALEERSGIIAIATGAMDCDETYLDGAEIRQDLEPGTYVYMEVADTGTGMDAETRKKLFDPFFTTKFTGRGLGLSAVLGIVRGHGGTIKVYSEPGSGSTFKVLFPALPGDGSPEEEGRPEPEDTWRGSGRILLADDEETVLAVGRRMLQKAGFEVEVARDGREALDIFRREPDCFDLVVLDLTMPQLSGEEVFREMRRIRPGVSVVVSSGYNEQEVRDRFAGKGLRGFIQKPYRTSELVGVIRGVVEGAREGG